MCTHRQPPLIDYVAGPKWPTNITCSGSHLELGELATASDVP
jgi:hypothetical protein